MELTARDRIFQVAGGRDRTGIAFPRILKILQSIAFERCPIHGDVAAKNSEGTEKITEIVARVTWPFGPRAIFEVAQIGNDIARGKLFGLLVEEKEIADVPEDLDLTAVLGDAEGGHEGGAGPGRPGAANHVGDTEERLGALLLPGSKSGRKLNGFVPGFLEPGRNLTNPIFQPLLESIAGSEQFIGKEGVELIRKFLAAEDDGDAARGQRCRQPSVAGKRLGAGDKVFLVAVGITGIDL